MALIGSVRASQDHELLYSVVMQKDVFVRCYDMYVRWQIKMESVSSADSTNQYTCLVNMALYHVYVLCHICMYSTRPRRLERRRGRHRDATKNKKCKDSSASLRFVRQVRGKNMLQGATKSSQ